VILYLDENFRGEIFLKVVILVFFF